MIASRRSFFLTATAFLAAPPIVRVASLMPVSVLKSEKFVMELDTAVQFNGTVWTTMDYIEIGDTNGNIYRVPVLL